MERWKVAIKDRVQEGRTKSIWTYSSAKQRFWVDLFNAENDSWNWYVDFYDHEQVEFNIATQRCKNIY